MLLSLRKNGLASLFKEVRVFKLSKVRATKAAVDSWSGRAAGDSADGPSGLMAADSLKPHVMSLGDPESIP